MARTPKHRFAFRNAWSTQYDVELMKEPNVFRPAMRGTAVKIPGRHGDLWLPENAYDTFVLPLECRMRHQADLNAISAWLSGDGELILGSQPDRLYRVRAVAVCQYSRISPVRSPRDFRVDFTCQPFRYEVNPAPITLKSPGLLINPGTEESAPQIIVHGTGNITLAINGVDIYLTGLSDYVVIDSELGDAYRVNALMNTHMQGGFPLLPPGRSDIAWSGDVQKVVFIPNWRWL